MQLRAVGAVGHAVVGQQPIDAALALGQPVRAEQPQAGRDLAPGGAYAADRIDHLVVALRRAQAGAGVVGDDVAIAFPHPHSHGRSLRIGSARLAAPIRRDDAGGHVIGHTDTHGEWAIATPATAQADLAVLAPAQ